LGLGDSSLNFSDEITESLFSGLLSIINSTIDSFGCLLDKLLLGLSDNFLVGNFLGLLLSSQLVNLGGLFLKLFVENSDDLFFVMFVDEVNKTLDQCIWDFVGKFRDRVLDIICLECFLEFLDNCFGTEDSLDLSSVLIWKLLSLVFFLGLVDGVE